MAKRLLTPFDHRQVMQSADFEIFHYNNPAICSCPPHQHDFYELFCLIADGLDYIVEGLRYAMGPGSIVLIPPGQLHRADVPGPARNIDRFVLWLSVDFARALTASMPQADAVLRGDLTGRNLIQPDAETAALMRQLLFALHREDGLNDSDSAQLSRMIAAQLLGYCCRCVAHGPEGVPHKAELRYHEIMRVYEHIVANLPDKELSVGMLAETFFMDKNTLTRQFKRHVGMTPGECIRHHRLEAVRRMIRRGAPMQQACVECGFSDYSAFYRAFRQAYGLSPSEYAVQATREQGHMPGEGREASAV